MDISNMYSDRISPYASAKLMFDCFPIMADEQMLNEVDKDSQDICMSAGALCLYAATLLTKVHELEPQNIECECTEREQALREMIRNNPKYSNFTDDQVSIMAHNLILKDIRNSFAHGNFKISYDVYSKRLYFILCPKRKDFVVDKPILVSKDSLFAVNRQYVKNLGLKYKFLNHIQLECKIKNQIGDELKKFLMPVDMLRLAENYLDRKIKYHEKYKPNANRYWEIYYPFLVSQLTYEQDDYYNLFNKDSNIFAKVAHIRNAISHDGFAFDNKTFDVTHTDRDNSIIDPLIKSVRMLKLIRDHKNLVLYTKELGFKDEDSQYLIDKIKSFFDSLFVYGGYEQEMQEESVFE